jgi:hypothetical protein
VCFRSILAKGLRLGTLLDVVPFVSFAGLSGGGVASCDIGLKLLWAVSYRFEYAHKGEALFGKLVTLQKVSELAKGITQMLCCCLAHDLVVQNADSSLCSVLLVRGQGRGRSRRFGRREGDDVCHLLACCARQVRGRCLGTVSR